MSVLYDIIQENFTKPYIESNISIVLQNYHFLLRQAKSSNIENVITLTMTDRSDEELINLILDTLPKQYDNLSLYVVNTEGHWTAMVAYCDKETIRIRYNDSNGVEMPRRLHSILYREEVVKALNVDSSRIDLRDYQTKFEGGVNACGLKTLRDMFFMLENPNAENLQTTHLYNDEYHKIIRILHVLYTHHKLFAIHSPKEAKILTNLIKSSHFGDNVDVLKKNVKILYHYLSSQVKDIEEDLVLGECSKIFQEIVAINDEVSKVLKEICGVREKIDEATVEKLRGGIQVINYKDGSIEYCYAHEPCSVKETINHENGATVILQGGAILERDLEGKHVFSGYQADDILF